MTNPACCGKESRWVDNGGKCKYHFCDECRKEVLVLDIRVNSYYELKAARMASPLSTVYYHAGPGPAPIDKDKTYD